MPKKNAFWFFMRELMDEMRNDGVEVSSFAEMPTYAGPKWVAMNPDQRRPYEEMVQSDATSVDETRSLGRMNNQRELISEQAEREQAKKDLKKRREEEIIVLRRNWPPGNGLIKERFQLIFFEYFVKTSEDEYFPCEVALLEFSLEEGVIRRYSSFIDPGPCPKGYMFEERLRSEQRHQIPCCDRFNIPHFNDTERIAFKDMGSILEQIVAFNSGEEILSNNRAFTFGDDVQMVIGCLDFLYSKAKNRVTFGPEALPRILPLEHLLPQFYFHSDQVTGPPPSVNSFQRVLTQSVWDYESGIRCDFHEDVETRFCALSQVYRWSFAIFDAMKVPVRDEDDPNMPFKRNPDNSVRSVFEFTLTAKHLPAPTKASYAVLKPSDVPCKNNERDIHSTTGSISATSLESSFRADSRTDVRTSGHRTSSTYPASSSSRSYQRPPLSGSSPPPPPGPFQFGRGFGLKSRASEVGALAKRSSAPPHGTAEGSKQQQQQQQEQLPPSFGRGRGCVLKSRSSRELLQ